MITFNTPCLRWKLVAAQKLHNGWPGFIAPYETRYLNKSVTITTTPAFGFGTTSQGASIVRAENSFMDTFGNVTNQPDPVVAEADFPYTISLAQNSSGPETWEVTETYFKHIINNGYFVIQTEVSLSNQYTVAMLDAELDALIAAVKVDAMPWNTLQANIAPDVTFGLSDVNNAIPPPFNYAEYLGASRPVAVPLRAAAYSAYTPGLVSAEEWFPNESVKVFGWIGLAGDYCLNSFFIDYDQNLLDQTCASGAGSCAAPFEVIPPPITPGRNAYTVLTPNGRCGG